MISIKNHFYILFLIIISNILIIQSCKSQPIISINCVNPQPTGSIECTLKGEVINRSNSNQLILLKKGDDPRIHGVICIPINNGKIEYILNYDHGESCELIFWNEYFKGTWSSVNFISDQGIVNFTLHPFENFNINVVKGIQNQNSDIKYNEMVKLIWDTVIVMMERLRKNGNHYSIEYLMLAENTGGSHFLIDEKGTVVTVTPSIEKIRDFLLYRL